MPEVISAERHLVANRISYLFNVFCKAFEAFVSYLHLSEGMKCIAVTHVVSQVVLTNGPVPEFVVNKRIGLFCNNMYSKIHF